MTSPGHVRTAKARASRTRAKHDRWIRELSAAGWTVIQAGHISVGATEVYEGGAELTATCERCRDHIGTWARERDNADVPLPAVLHAVTGHTCEGPK